MKMCAVSHTAKLELSVSALFSLTNVLYVSITEMSSKKGNS